jgi:hypothetical protein
MPIIVNARAISLLITGQIKLTIPPKGHRNITIVGNVLYLILFQLNEKASRLGYIHMTTVYHN